jgi:hypothetical protein
MPDERLDHYNPNYPYKKEGLDVEKNIKNGHPVVESVNNAALFPDSIKNNVDMEQLKPFH